MMSTLPENLLIKAMVIMEMAAKSNSIIEVWVEDRTSYIFQKLLHE